MMRLYTSGFFFHRENLSGPLVRTLNWFSIYLRISQVAPLFSEYMERDSCHGLEQCKKLFLVGFVPNSSPILNILKYCSVPIEAVEENKFHSKFGYLR
jgi:hypothetical protein